MHSSISRVRMQIVSQWKNLGDLIHSLNIEIDEIMYASLSLLYIKKRNFWYLTYVVNFWFLTHS